MLGLGLFHDGHLVFNLMYVWRVKGNEVDIITSQLELLLQLLGDLKAQTLIQPGDGRHASLSLPHPISRIYCLWGPLRVPHVFRIFNLPSRNAI